MTEATRDIINCVLDDRYHVEKLVGQGGMGEVYLARQVRLNRNVAVKVPRPGVWSDPGFRRRFTREAHSMARVQHENICQIFDVFVSEDPSEVSYLVLEYVEGERLDRWVAANVATITIGRLLDILSAIARALDSAHALNIIHRDIKPSNILITPEGVPKIMDFGVAQVPDDMFQTRAGQAVGTPAFMAPEQVRGREVGPKADQYAFAMTLYKIFTGTIAFKADRSEQLIYMQLHEAPTPPSEYNPNLPFPIELILLKGLAKDQHERFETCSQLIAMMRMVLESHAKMPAYTLFPEAERYGQDRLEVGSQFDDLFETRAWHRKYLKELLAGGLILLILFLTALLYLLSSPGDPPPARRPIPTDRANVDAAPLPPNGSTDVSGAAVEAPASDNRAEPEGRPLRPVANDPRSSVRDRLRQRASVDPRLEPPTPAPAATPVPTPTPAAGDASTSAGRPASVADPTPPAANRAPLVVATPTPLAVRDPNLLARDNVHQIDRNNLEQGLRDFLETDLPRLLERKDRTEFRRRLLLMPATRREEVMTAFDALASANRRILCTATMGDSFTPFEDRVETTLRVTLRGVAESATPDALPAYLYRKAQPVPVVLESRDGEWYFARFPDFLAEAKAQSSARPR